MHWLVQYAVLTGSEGLGSGGIRRAGDVSEMAPEVGESPLWEGQVA